MADETDGSTPAAPSTDGVSTAKYVPLEQYEETRKGLDRLAGTMGNFMQRMEPLINAFETYTPAAPQQPTPQEPVYDEWLTKAEAKRIAAEEAERVKREMMQNSQIATASAQQTRVKLWWDQFYRQYPDLAGAKLTVEGAVSAVGAQANQNPAAYQGLSDEEWADRIAKRARAELAQMRQSLQPPNPQTPPDGSPPLPVMTPPSQAAMPTTDSGEVIDDPESRLNFLDDSRRQRLEKVREQL